MYRASINLNEEFAEEMKAAYAYEGYTINGRIKRLIQEDVKRIINEAEAAGNLHCRYDKEQEQAIYQFMDAAVGPLPHTNGGKVVESDQSEQ